jgi:hypothetical protein
VSHRETALLAAARRGLAPTPGDAARVRIAVDAAVRASSPAPQSGTAPASKLGSAPVHWARVAAALALAGATGAGGYALGFRAGYAQNAAHGVSPVVVAHPASSVAERTESPPALVASADPTLPLAPPRRTVTEPPHASAAPPVASAAAESPLEVETRLLARVARALSADNPRLALGLLGELDREVPGGQLEEERQAARVIAHCRLGTESASKLAGDFTARYAESAYRERIRTACETPSGTPSSE